MKSLDKKSKILRKFIIDMIKSRKGGHLGPALSLVEILYVLYEHILKINPKKPNWSDRDRLIFSKGHGCLALYAILAEKGFIKKSELSTFVNLTQFQEDTLKEIKYQVWKPLPDLLATVCPQPLESVQPQSLKKFKTFVVLGDGEMNEGSNWEALMTSHKHKLDNMTIIIDRNHLQSYGKTKEILDIEPLRDKLVSQSKNS